jgi:archaellum biogenesis protein FlaJ (TadC family)
MIMTDASIVTITLPELRRGLGFSASGMQTVVTAYNTAFDGALISADALASGYQLALFTPAALALTTALLAPLTLRTASDEQATPRTVPH